MENSYYIQTTREIDYQINKLKDAIFSLEYSRDQLIKQFRKEKENVKTK